MRCNQVSIFIERFCEYVPKNYPADVQRISVYCDDSRSIYAALAKANAMVVNELNEYESIGTVSYVSTNEYSKDDYREMRGKIPIEKTKYEDDLKLEFTYKPDELLQDRIWVHENFDEIVQLIRLSENKNDLVIQLKEQFGLRDFQIKKLLSMRLDMFSKHDYLIDLEKQKEYESRKNDCKVWNPKRMIHYYEKDIRELEKKINEYKTYIMIAENYQDMIEILVQNPSFKSYADIMHDKYGFNQAQTRMVKYVTVENLISKDKYLEEIQKLENEIERCKKNIKEYAETHNEEK